MSEKKSKHKHAKTKAVIKAVKKALNKEGYKYDFHEKENTFVSGFTTNGVGIRLYLVIREEMMSFVCGPELDDRYTNTDRLLPVLNELNSKLFCGSFYHNADTGRVVFELGCPVSDVEMDGKFIISLLDRALTTTASGAKTISEKIGLSEDDRGSMYC